MPDFNTQSPSERCDGDCALNPRDTRRFVTTVTLGTPFGLMDPAAAGPLPRRTPGFLSCFAKNPTLRPGKPVDAFAANFV